MLSSGDKALTQFLLQDWEKCLLANLFGWKRPDGFRRYRKFFLYIGAKNGKTELFAGIVCYVGFKKAQFGDQIYSMAREKKQATLVFDPAVAMIEADETMNNMASIYKSFKSIKFHATGSTYKVLSKEAKAQEGLGATYLFVDELHVQDTRDQIDVLEKGAAARSEPLSGYASTADFQRQSPCNEELDYAKEVRDGTIHNEKYLPFIYEPDPKLEWDDPRCWAEANPNLGISVKLEFLQDRCDLAKRRPSMRNQFIRYHCNRKTEQSHAWIPVEHWKACGGKITPEMLIGKRCFGGLDMSSITDLTSFALYFPEFRAVLVWFWVPGETAERRQREDKYPYVEWAGKGLLEMTGGNCVDYGVVRRKIVSLRESYDIVDIGVDPSNSQDIQTQLEGEGFTIERFFQTFRNFTGPMKEVERLVEEREIEHFDNEVLTWNFSNIIAKEDPDTNGLRPSKKLSKGKIDGAVAMFMAIGQSLGDNGAGFNDGGLSAVSY